MSSAPPARRSWWGYAKIGRLLPERQKLHRLRVSPSRAVSLKLFDLIGRLGANNRLAHKVCL
jgi:hypothetical protein